MSGWPEIPFGHTPFEAAFGRSDVYSVAPDPARRAKRPLRVALAGCGGVAQAKWIPALRRLQTIGEPVTICGVADPTEAARDKGALLAGGAAFATLTELIRATRPDVVLVLSADAVHVALAREAIAAGIPCLVEKPLARSFAEAAALVSEAAARGVLLASVANKRFSPPYALAKALIAKGALRHEPTLFAGKFTLGYDDVDLLEAGTVHLFDLVRWFMGPVKALHARGVRAADGRLQSAILSLAFQSGAIGSVVTSDAGLSFKPWERVEIFGRKAFIVVDDQIETALFDEEVGPAKVWRPAIPNTLLFDETFGGYSGQLENVLDAVRGTVALEATAADGAGAVALIEAARRSLERGADIDLAEEGLVL